MLPRNATHLNLSLVSPSGVTAAPPTPRSSASYSAFNKNFVDTLEDRGNVSDYPLKRTRSASSFENEEQMYTYYKQLEAKIGILQRELLGLRQKVETVEEDMGKTQWGVKYSRRGTIVANLLLGLWIFWSRFVKRLQRRKTSLLQNVIGMSQSQRLDNTFNQFLYETWLFSFAWKRNIGITISSGASVWFAFSKEFLPWTHYFNLFSNMLYISAQWASSRTDFGAKTIKDYIGPRPDGENLSPRGHADESTTHQDHDEFFCVALSEIADTTSTSRKRAHGHRRSSSDVSGAFLTAPLERRHTSSGGLVGTRTQGSPPKKLQPT